MRVEWSTTAREERKALFHRIAADNRLAAVNLNLLSADRLEALVRFPAMYPAGKVPGTRHIVLNREHVLVYAWHPQEEVIHILRIVGTRQQRRRLT